MKRVQTGVLLEMLHQLLLGLVELANSLHLCLLLLEHQLELVVLLLLVLLWEWIALEGLACRHSRRLMLEPVRLRLRRLVARLRSEGVLTANS